MKHRQFTLPPEFPFGDSLCCTAQGSPLVSGSTAQKTKYRYWSMMTRLGCSAAERDLAVTSFIKLLGGFVIWAVEEEPK